MNKGRVSIIMPVYNSAIYLRETLDSIVAQSYENWECICVDDGSDDSSVEIVKEYTNSDSRIISMIRPQTYKKGGNSCRNYGFEMSNGEFLQWFDSDDLMHPLMLERKVRLLKENDATGYVICHTAYFTGDNLEELYPYDQCLNSDNVLLDHLTYKTKFFTPGPMFRREFLKDLKLFNIELKRHQEREFFFRVVLKDKNYGIIDDIFVFRRMHSNQLSLAANKSSEKNLMKFIVNKMNFNNFVRSKQKDIGVVKYFQDFFFRFTYRLFKERRFLYSITSFYMSLKALFMRSNHLL